MKKYRQLRARLIARGLTLRSFARKHGFKQATVYAAARGDRAGVESYRINQKLTEELANANP